MQADFVEPDLVPTSDGHLVAIHDLGMSVSTNVDEFPEFADRKKFVQVNENLVLNDWFTEDFTLSEIKQLRVR